MKIGLPKALLYYRYQHLWKTFFKELGCNVIVSDATNQETLLHGTRRSIDESCLPSKIYLGHVEWLLPRCDYILVPRFESLSKAEEYCVRFFGLYDIVQNTYREAKLLTYNIEASRHLSELHGFMQMGKALGKPSRQTIKAYKIAKQKQKQSDDRQYMQQILNQGKEGLKILLVGQSYILHDPYMCGTIVRMIKEQGGIPLFSDYCDRAACRHKSKELSQDLYWVMNKEMIGSIVLNKNKVDGILLLTAFPCGTDSLVNDLVLRRVKDIPIIQILLDEQRAEAGLQTRVESFMDILHERRKLHA